MLLAAEREFIENGDMEMPALEGYIQSDKNYLDDTLRIDGLVKEYPNLDE